MDNDVQLKTEILQSSAAEKLDFTDPRNRFTLWHTGLGASRLCGSYSELSDALAAAKPQPESKDLVILDSHRQELIRVTV